MGKSVFVSYCHQQKDWVRQYLVPCLEAGGATVLIDYQQFQAGRTLLGQMDATQDSAELSVLVLSPDYLASKNCVHEMERAIACNKFVAVLRVDCAAPDEVKKTLYVDLRDDKAADKWVLLLRECDAGLGVTAPDWLNARDEIVRYLQRGDSVNLVALRKPGFSKTKWRERDVFRECRRRLVRRHQLGGAVAALGE